MNDCCGTCGNKGVVEALATCCKCLTIREHLYCMRVFHLEQPAQWYCQDCDPEKEATPPTCDAREDLATTSTLTASRLNNDTRQFDNPSSSNKRLKKVPFKWERKVQTGRTKYIPVVEALKLPSGSKKSDQAAINNFRSSPALPKTTGNLASLVKNVTCSQRVIDLKHTADTSAQTRVEMAPRKAFLSPSPAIGWGSKYVSGKVTSPMKSRPSSQFLIDRKRTTDTRSPTIVQMAPKKAFLTRSPSIGYGSKIISDNYVVQSPKQKQPIDHLADIGRPKSAEPKVEQATKKEAQIPSRSTDSAPVVKVALTPPSLSTVRASRIISGMSEEQALKEKQIERLHPGNHLVDVADSRTTEFKEALVMKKASLRPSTSTNGALGRADFPNVHHKSSEVEKDKLKNVQPNAEIYRGPAQDASWKGSFKMISDEGLCSGIQGFPPSIVLKKVYAMSKMMPGILELELIPRADLWKTIFQDRCPDFDDVGLFFFPSENRRFDNYFTWLEFIGKRDLVMRMCMYGVELLVFTSTHLHKNCQTWKGVHFFWGAFRVEDVARSLADNKNILRPCSPNEAGNRSSEGDGSQVVNMEGRMDLGMEDVVMKITSGGESSGAVGNPFITPRTDVSSARLALSRVEEEQGDESPLGNEKMYEQRSSGSLLQTKSSSVDRASLQIDARAIVLSSNEVHNDIPPGFKELQTLKPTVVSNIPPGFEKMHTHSPETSKYKLFSTSPSSASANNFSSHTTDRAQVMASRKEGDLNSFYVKIKSEIR